MKFSSSNCSSAEEGKESDWKEVKGRKKKVKLGFFHLPTNRKTAIITDSQGKHLNAFRLDPERDTAIKAVPGLTLEKMIKKMKDTEQKPSELVERAVLFVGGNDLAHKDTADIFFQNLDECFELIRHIYPRATLYLMDVLPRKDLLPNIDYLRKDLKEWCLYANIKFIALTSVDGFNDFHQRGIYPGIHLNQHGLNKVCHKLKSVLHLSWNTPASNQGNLTRGVRPPFNRRSRFQHQSQEYGFLKELAEILSPLLEKRLKKNLSNY